VIEVEDADGGTSVVGCGRISVDVRAELDPDRSAGVVDAAAPAPPLPPTLTPPLPPTLTPSPTATVTAIPTPAPTGPADRFDLPPGPAILVGDFATRDQADAAAGSIASASAEGGTVGVIDSSSAPNVIQPGVWGVVVPIASGADPEVALQAFRVRFPDLAPWTWMVTL
jgi:hypothetical protein